MKIIDNIKTKIIGNIEIPLYYKFIKKAKTLCYFREFKKSQWLTEEENKLIQRKKLFNLLNYAQNNIPYYKQITKEKNIKISEETVFEDIKKFPILTRELLKKNFNSLYYLKNNYYKNFSGGSTGEPVSFYQDKYFLEKNLGLKILFGEWSGREIGGKQIKLWGSERDVLEGKQGLKAKIKAILFQEKVLNSFNMSSKNMNKYLDIVNHWKPQIILGYANALYEFSLFIKNNKKKVYSPKGIISAAGGLTEDMKKTIKEVFNTKVLNKYGTREVGDVACSCEKEEGLHVNPLNHFIEILNDDFKKCDPMEVGNLYITTLNNKTMPLIRYKIGDMAVYSDKPCSCKRSWPLLKEITGRETSVFKTKSKNIIPGEFFIHFVGVVYNKGFIKKFQVIQENYNLITIKIVLIDQKEFNKYKEDIIKNIKSVMGEDCKVNFEFVDEIQSTASGKYLYTISKI